MARSLRRDGWRNPTGADYGLNTVPRTEGSARFERTPLVGRTAHIAADVQGRACRARSLIPAITPVFASA
jgi:hypothetical protein